MVTARVACAARHGRPSYWPSLSYLPSSRASLYQQQRCGSGIPTLRDWSQTKPATVELASIAASPRPSAELEVSCETFLNTTLAKAAAGSSAMQIGTISLRERVSPHTYSVRPLD
jgi:hypothetical protein